MLGEFSKRSIVVLTVDVSIHIVL